jgi:hypothetical protein
VTLAGIADSNLIAEFGGTILKSRLVRRLTGHLRSGTNLSAFTKTKYQFRFSSIAQHFPPPDQAPGYPPLVLTLLDSLNLAMRCHQRNLLIEILGHFRQIIVFTHSHLFGHLLGVF